MGGEPVCSAGADLLDGGVYLLAGFILEGGNNLVSQFGWGYAAAGAVDYENDAFDGLVVGGAAQHFAQVQGGGHVDCAVDVNEGDFSSALPGRYSVR